MTKIAVIFDFDGVIANTEPAHLAATQHVLSHQRVTLTSTEYEDRYLGYNDRDLFSTLSRDRALGWRASDIDKLITDKGRAFERAVAGGSTVYPSAARCIERLSAAAIPLAIASGAFAEEIESILSAAGLRRHFRAIVGAGDYVNGKPSPDPFVEAARRLAIDPRATVAIEDSQWGLDSAQAAGCATIAVTNSYRRDVLTAHLIVDSLDEVDIAALTSLQPLTRRPLP